MKLNWKKGLLWLAVLSVLFAFCSCSKKEGSGVPGEETKQPENTAQSTEAPSAEPTEKPEDFSLTTTLPDGRNRIEARVLSIVNDKTYKVKTQNGEEEIKLSDKVSSNAKILGVKEQSKIIVTIKDGVADSIELVTSE